MPAFAPPALTIGEGGGAKTLSQFTAIMHFFGKQFGFCLEDANSYASSEEIRLCCDANDFFEQCWRAGAKGEEACDEFCCEGGRRETWLKHFMGNFDRAHSRKDSTFMHSDEKPCYSDFALYYALIVMQKIHGPFPDYFIEHEHVKKFMIGMREFIGPMPGMRPVPAAMKFRVRKAVEGDDSEED